MRGLEPWTLRLVWVLIFLSAVCGVPTKGRAARYRVTLTTLSAGEEAFERFGHTVLSIEDKVGQTGWVYSFGTFDADAPYQWHKALHKRLRYWVIAMSPLLMTLRYDHREGVVQELALDDPQVALLSARLTFLTRPENREYPYDLFTDNCVTRLRDLIDAACGGVLRQRTAGRAPFTFRQEVMRTLAPVPLLAAVATLIYGPYTDAPRSRWETLFLPEALRSTIAEIELGEGGARHPLVQKQGRWQGEFWKPPRGLPHPLWGPVILGLLVLCGGLLLVRGYAQRARAVLGAAGALLALLMGLVGLVLFYLNTTPHLCFQHNGNRYLLDPLSLAAAPLFVLLACDRLGQRGRSLLLLGVSLSALCPVGHFLIGHLTFHCSQVHGGVWIVSAALHATLAALALYAYNPARVTLILRFVSAPQQGRCVGRGLGKYLSERQRKHGVYPTAT